VGGGAWGDGGEWGGDAAVWVGGGGGWGGGGGGAMNQDQLQNRNGYNHNNGLKFRQDFVISNEIFSPRVPDRDAGGRGGERSSPRKNRNSGAHRSSAQQPVIGRSGAGSRAASHRDVESVDSSVSSVVGVRQGRYKPSVQPDAPIGKGPPVPPAARNKQKGRRS
jgi:hypothetical protein